MRSLHSGMLRSWRTSDLAMHRLYQRKMEEEETRSLTESLQRRTHMCMIRVFKGGEKMVKVVGGLLCGSATRECRRKLPRGLEQALHTTSHHHIDFNPHHISNHRLHHNISPLTQSSAMAVKPITGVSLPIGTLEPRTGEWN